MDEQGLKAPVLNGIQAMVIQVQQTGLFAQVINNTSGWDEPLSTQIYSIIVIHPLFSSSFLLKRLI